MRRFRFVCPEDEIKDYSANMQVLVIGETYSEAQLSKIHLNWSNPETSLVKNDWEEVFDEPKQLHKDTDLGYFAGLAMQGILANEGLRMKILADASQQKISAFEAIQNESILSAKELIKQLDSEMKS